MPDAMARGLYRITRPTLALFESDGGYVARPLPDDACILFDPDDALARGANLIEVIFEGQSVKMFAADLRNLAAPET